MKIEKIRQDILGVVRQRMGAEDEYDTSRDEAISKLTPAEIINKYLGDENWGRHIIGAYESLLKEDKYMDTNDSISRTRFIPIIIIALAVIAMIVFCACAVWAEEYEDWRFTDVQIVIDYVINIESSGNPSVVNKHSNAIGLMQITPIVLEEWNEYSRRGLGMLPNYSKKDLFNPEINEEIGTWYLNDRIPLMLRRYKITDTIDNRLIAYNWGIGNLRKYLRGEKKLPRETVSYIRKYHKLEKGVCNEKN